MLGTPLKACLFCEIAKSRLVNYGMQTTKKQLVLDALNDFTQKELMGECLSVEGVDETPIQEEKLRRVLRATSPACVRRIALNYAHSSRAQPFRRVSESFLAAVEANALNFIKSRIDRHPSRGVTLT